MLNAVTILEKITIDPPVAQIYSRLGFHKKMSLLPLSRRRETDRRIQEAAALITLKGSFLTLPIRENNGRKIRLGGGPTFESAKLARFLDGCREAVLMGATAGRPVMDAIAEKTREEGLVSAVIYDATASEMTDAALDWMMDYINRQLRREGKRLLPARFSAGYGDFALENQKTIHRKLQLKKIGVTLTPSCLMVPEKSVTAVGGIL